MWPQTTRGKPALLGAVAMLLGGAMLLYGVSVAAMGLAPTYALSIVVLLCFGGAYVSIASTINTTIQLVVLEELRGYDAILLGARGCDTVRPQGLLNGRGCAN